MKQFLSLSFILCLGVFPREGFAQDSIIEKLQTYSDSIVQIQSVSIQIVTPGQKPFFDEKTRKFFTVRRIRPVQKIVKGGGIVLDNEIIVTNAHNLQNKSIITATVSTGEKLNGKIEKVIPGTDLAFMRTAIPDHVPAIPMALSESAKLGDRVYTIGSSEVNQSTISEGRITGLGQQNRVIQGEAPILLLQVNFNIYKGDSGSPLLNDKGELLGIMTAARMKTPRTAYAIPVDLIKKHYLELMTPTREQ